MRVMSCQSAAIVSPLLFVSCLSFRPIDTSEWIMNAVIVALKQSNNFVHFVDYSSYCFSPSLRSDFLFFLQEGMFCRVHHHKSVFVQLTISLWICCNALIAHFTIFTLFALLLPLRMNKGK